MARRRNNGFRTLNTRVAGNSEFRRRFSYRILPKEHIIDKTAAIAKIMNARRVSASVNWADGLTD
jgi:hypothetical protein